MTFEITMSEIMEEGDVKSTWTLRKACVKRLVIVDEVKEVCRSIQTFGTPLRFLLEYNYKYVLF